MTSFVNVTLFDGYYADRYKVNEDGEVYSVKKKGLLKPHPRGDYVAVELRKNCVDIWISIHRLIAEMFIPNPKNLPDVHHINGNKYDNRVCNLKWTDEKTHQREHFGKDVVCLKDGVIVKIYPSLKSVEDDGHSCSHVSKCCNHIHKYKSHHGFQWEFIENVSSDLINKYNKHNN